ncbi:hypothetical protein ACLSZP_09930 [Avibacterium avium]
MPKVIATDYFEITPLNYQAKCGEKSAKFLPHFFSPMINPLKKQKKSL